MTRRTTNTLAALLVLGAVVACSDGEKATTSDNSPREAGMTADSSPAYSTPGTGSALSDTLRATPGAGTAPAGTPPGASASAPATTATTPDSARRP